MTINRDDVKEEIKRRIDIVELVSQYVPLHRAGRRFGARCPFHQEKTASFYVDPERGHWKCFGCGAYGDIFSFVMQIEGLTFPEAAERLAQRAGVQWTPGPGAEKHGRERSAILKANEAAAEYFQRMLRGPQGKPAQEYIAKRGLSEKSVSDFQIGYAPEGWDGLLRALSSKGFDEKLLETAGLVKPRSSGGCYDVFRHRVIFPIIDVSKRVVGFGGRALDPEEQAKYLNSPDTPVFKKGAMVYGLNVAREPITKAKTALVVEGYIDVISLVEAGFENVVACLGTATTELHLRLLARYCENLCFVYDGDAAGLRAALRNITVFEASRANARIAVLPEGLDPDDCVRKLGPPAFQRVLDDAVSFPEYQVRMAFAQYNVNDTDGRLRAAREAVDVLLKVQDPARREELLDRVADWWAQSDPARGEALAQVLRLEFRRRRSEQERGPVRRAESPRDRGRIMETVARQAGEVTPAVLRLEGQVLSAALNDVKCCLELAKKLRAEDFTDERHRAIASALLAQVTEEPFVPQDVIETFEENEGVRERAVELLVGTAEGFEEEFSDCIAKLHYYRGARGLRPDFQVQPEAEDEVGDEQKLAGAEDDGEDYEAWRRKVATAIAEGQLSQDNPDYIRFFRLAKKFRGAGRGGMIEHAGITPLSATEGVGGSTTPPAKLMPGDQSVDADERS
ncbi:MAG: DNA primase [Armatimonadota bacterium]